jgi:tellurite resistance protein TerC
MPVDVGFLYVIVMVIFLEGILSIDNAAVLGAMVSVLPTKEIVPWPAPLRFLAQPVHRLLGGQQSAALKVGLLGAYVGRGAMLFFATIVIQNDWLKLLGALYLIKLAMENLGEPEPGEEEQVEVDRVARRGFWGVVLAVELADLTFSLDNVVAVVALSNEFWIVMFGVAIGILTMRFAAGIFTWMIAREPVLKAAAYVIVFNIGMELLLSEFGHLEIDSKVKFMISAGTLILAVVYAHVKPLQLLRPVLYWIGEGMANVNELIDWALRPIIGLIKLVFQLIGAIVKLFVPRTLAAQQKATVEKKASAGH